jgi:large conductance mechanosensitive channel
MPGKEKGAMKDFKAFILRGNVVDLAVGVVVGAAFGQVVSSLVKNVFTPFLGVFGTPDFSDLTLKAGKATINYGLFLNATIAFLLVATAVFWFVVRPINRLTERKKVQMPAQRETRECPECLSSIPAQARRCAFCTAEIPALIEAPDL